MGPGILIILVGVAVGALLAAAPRGIWLVTESWKYRDPEANEPSELYFGLTRAGGVLLIVFALIFGGSLIAEDRGRAAEEQAQREAELAEANFVPPAPERRGLLPVLGYAATPVRTGGFSVDVYYLAPSRSFPAKTSAMAKSMSSVDVSYPCQSTPSRTTAADGRVLVSVELVWAPERLGDVDDADTCRMGGSHKIDEFSLGHFPAVPTITTDAPIADIDGIEITPARPDNAVPQVAEKPAPLTTRPTRSDRGQLPIVGYEINGTNDSRFVGKRYLDISYLRPKKSDAHAGSTSGPGQGCEIVPAITGVGTPTVTVGLRLVWSDPYGYYDDEDDRNCRLGNEWSGVMTSRWGEVTGAPVVLTDGPIVTPRGQVVLPAAPGNRVPER